MIDLINGRTPEEIKRGLRWIFHDCDADGEDCNECECVEECHKLVEDDVARDALAYIERLEAAQPKWISVEERLPGDDVDVLVYIASKKENVDSVIAITHYTHSMHGFNIEGWCSPWPSSG